MQVSSRLELVRPELGGPYGLGICIRNENNLIEYLSLTKSWTLRRSWGWVGKKRADYPIWTTNARILKWQLLPLGRGNKGRGMVIGHNKI